MMQLKNHRIFKDLLALLVLVTAIPCQAQVGAEASKKQRAPLAFGGLHLNSSIAEIKANFPNSQVNPDKTNITIWMAKPDVKDDVTFAVIFIRNTKPDYAKLNFERQFDQPMPESFTRNPFNTNPRCEPTLNKLIAAYGKPYGPFDAEEEGLRYKDYVWDNDKEKLIYTCARFDGRSAKKQWAAQIKLTHNLPGTYMHRNCIEASQ